MSKMKCKALCTGVVVFFSLNLFGYSSGCFGLNHLLPSILAVAEEIELVEFSVPYVHNVWVCDCVCSLVEVKQRQLLQLLCFALGPEPVTWFHFQDGVYEFGVPNQLCLVLIDLIWLRRLRIKQIRIAASVSKQVNSVLFWFVCDLVLNAICIYCIYCIISWLQFTKSKSVKFFIFQSVCQWKKSLLKGISLIMLFNSRMFIWWFNSILNLNEFILCSKLYS